MDSVVFEQKKQEFLRKLQVSTEQIQHIMNVEQRTPEWLEYRKNRITGSMYGAAAGHNKYTNLRKLLHQLLWVPFKGNEATRHGSYYEKTASEVYEKFIRKYECVPCFFEYPGLIICKKYPWLAGSPDGIPCIGNIRILLEIKCPFYKSGYPFIPHYYYDQIQGLMGLLQLPYCDFFTWSKQRIQIRRYAFDPVYWKTVLFPRLETFYMKEYLPRLVLKEAGILQPGEIDPPLTVPMSMPSLPSLSSLSSLPSLPSLSSLSSISSLLEETQSKSEEETVSSLSSSSASLVSVSSSVSS